jgi:hypothetical protein
MPAGPAVNYSKQWPDMGKLCTCLTTVTKTNKLLPVLLLSHHIDG